jgi:phospholipid/cholesterol/gamma-HCH transport system ATP-binding protein
MNDSADNQNAKRTLDAHAAVAGRAAADREIILKIEHLRKHYGNQIALDDINLEVRRGEILSIIGQSGHGKSQLLRHVVGLIVPDGGRILLDDEVISSPAMKLSDFDRHRRRFGMLFQGAALFDSMSVGENIAFPLREHTDMNEKEIARLVAESLEMVGLTGLEHLYPAEFSGGMRSRLGLARAIALKPEIMCYDEPTSALDPIMTDKINDLILDLRSKLGMTSIIVTHDMSSAYKVSDHIAMIFEHKIIFHGTPAEIRASRHPYIQQFIRGQRKLHYAIEGKESYDRQIDLSRLRAAPRRRP